MDFSSVMGKIAPARCRIPLSPPFFMPSQRRTRNTGEFPFNMELTERGQLSKRACDPDPGKAIFQDAGGGSLLAVSFSASVSIRRFLTC